MTFGLYKGKQVCLFHQRRNKEGKYGLPYICKIRLPMPQEYQNFMERKVENGYQSEKLILKLEDGFTWFTRSRNTNKYEMEDNPLMIYINRFKRICKNQMTIRKSRVRARTHRIHEELVAAAWHPRRIERYMEMGLSIDEICEL